MWVESKNGKLSRNFQYFFFSYTNCCTKIKHKCMLIKCMNIYTCSICMIILYVPLISESASSEHKSNQVLLMLPILASLVTIYKKYHPCLPPCSTGQWAGVVIPPSRAHFLSRAPTQPTHHLVLSLSLPTCLTQWTRGESVAASPESRWTDHSQCWC